MTTEAAHPFVIGDEPVVTFERTERNTLSWLQGFARRNVEAFLPVSATMCLDILARFERTRQTRRRLRHKSTVNMGQTAGATKYCLGDIESQEIDVVLQSGVRQDADGNHRLQRFDTHHIDHHQALFDILMGRRPRAAWLSAD